MRHLVLLPLFLLMACSSSNLSQSELAVNLSDLLSKQWMVISVNGKLLLKNTAISFTVSENGKVSGNAGVNNYFGQWKIKEGKITSSKMASTKKFGIEPKGIMQQEQQFLTKLPTITHWYVDGEVLQLFDDNRVVIQLQLFQ